MRQVIRTLGICAALVLFTLPALGNTLDAAKAAGTLGEGPDGYLHVVDSGATDAEALASSINAKRKAKYQSIATDQGIPLDAVATRAGKKLVGRTPAGQYFMKASGEWIKK
jgi:uncharacterized protein YdbL (DUF1318 family)